MDTLPITTNPAPVTIVATMRPVAVVEAPAASDRKRLRKPGQPATTKAKIRNVWTAAFAGGQHSGLSTSGHASPNAAIAALIRAAANRYDLADDIVDFFASLFGFDPKRGPDVYLARAVRIKARNPIYAHPGVRVLVQHTADTAPDRVAATVALLNAAGERARAERGQHEVMAPPAKCGPKTRVTESEPVPVHTAAVIAEAGESANYGAKALHAPAAEPSNDVLPVPTERPAPRRVARTKAKGGVA